MQRTSTAALRVCDRCIRKKIKCNQARPTCSRCFELGETCSYTSVRRRPGPVRGCHYTSNPSRSPRLSERSRPRYRDTTRAPAEDLSGAESSPYQGDHVSQFASDCSLPERPQQRLDSSPQSGSDLRFPRQQEEYLLGTYFDMFQDANPIYCKERFLSRYYGSLCSGDLIGTMVTITAKLTGSMLDKNTDDGFTIDVGIDHLLSSSLLEDDLIGDTPSLDQFRKAYLLAFYEFHQFPGHHAWLRVGRITRMAYRIGLDRLDFIRTIYPDWNSVTDEDIQEWRALWWCIYRLDSYSNISCGTPYLIDDTLISISFSQSKTTQQADKLYLRPVEETLSRLLLAAPFDPETLLENVHNITVATVRQAGLVMRMRLLPSRVVIAEHVSKVQRLLATVRLSLPPRWLNPGRNAFSNESRIDHHARMITAFHLRMAQLLLALAEMGLCLHGHDGDAGGWLASWQRVLETCQDIASIVEQWDTSFCLAVDPAISFTIFIALIFLDLHKKVAASTSSGEEQFFRSEIDHQIEILHLQLGHFGNIWTISGLLKLSFESFSQSVAGPLSRAHIALILSRFEAPLHPRWLQFLSSAHLELAVCH